MRGRMRWQVLQTDRPDDAHRSAPYERAAADRRALRRRPGAAASTSASRASSIASPTPTTLPAAAPDRRARARARQHQPAVLLARLDARRRSCRSTPRRTRSTSRSPTASAARRACIPTLSVDSAWTLERDTTLFGRDVRQTLEPRLFYVNTPYRRQDDLPNFDASAKDFNFDSHLHREHVLRRRPRLRLEPADGRRDVAHPRSRHRRRGAAASASRSAIASATSASRPTACR